jgi:hypothetical protein
MTEAMGTQKVALPSSVCQAALAKSGKLSSPSMSEMSDSWPRW